MRLKNARRISQIFFFGLFVFFFVASDLDRLKGYPVSLFLEMDPLVALANGLAAHEIYRGLLWSLVIIIPTLLLGRFFCGWVCPYGALHHFIGWAFGNKTPRERIHANRYRAIYQIKYGILTFMLVAALLGSLQIGWLDPISLFHRSVTTAVLPAFDSLFPSVLSVRAHEFSSGWVIGFLLFFFVGMNVIIPRFFCRVLCPLGALLGVLSRFALWRIDRSHNACTGCNACLLNCEGACDPHAELRKSECFVCFNCLEDCGDDALAYRFLPSRSREVTGPEISGRRVVLASLLGAAFYPLARNSGASTRNFNPGVIRPPGSTPEPEFLERCLKCEQCLRVCPTNVLQPAAMQAGLEGIWTPVLNMKMGYCELNCTLCSQVCPTGAIQTITIEQKRGLGESNAERGPIKVGTAFYDRGRCLPWAMETACVVCQEVCPTSPKAIHTRSVTLQTRKGETVTLQQPYVDPVLCIGCGICEHECPVKDTAAIRVTAIGETRSRERSLLLPD